jgi:TolA-binding protein
MARLRIGELALRDGRAKEAAAYYKALIEDKTSGLPKDQLLFGLAEAHEAAGQALEARRAYSDLVNRHPQSPYAEEARQKMDALATVS